MQKKYFLSIILSFCGNLFAAESKKVNLELLIWDGYTHPEMVSNFKEKMKKKHNVNVTLNIKNADTNFDIFNNLRSKKADIISPSHNLFKDKRFNYIGKKLLVPLTKKDVPNVANIEEELLSNGMYSEKGILYAIPLCQGPYGLAYNKNLVKNAPTSWEILWSKENKGNFTLAGDFPEVNVYITGMTLGVPNSSLFSIKLVREKNFKKRLTALAKNSGKMYGVIEEPKDLKGKKFAATWGFAIKRLKEQGEDWVFANPKEGTTWWIDTFAVGSHLKGIKKKVALDFVNFALSPEYQERVVASELQAGTTVKTVDDKFKTRFDNIPKEKRILWQVLSKRERNGFTKHWKAARGK
ncbi:MAG: PotD/PotF family extracellular solute-binding protein [Oligoflexales bacterium]